VEQLATTICSRDGTNATLSEKNLRHQPPIKGNPQKQQLAIRILRKKQLLKGGSLQDRDKKRIMILQGHVLQVRAQCIKE